MRKALLFAPMLMLLLTACGGEEKDPAAELQAQYANLTGAVMEAEVSCHYADEDRAYTLLCDYAPDRSTVTVLSPANLAGISATVENGTLTLSYEDISLDAGGYSAAAISPVAALPKLMQAAASGYVTEKSEETVGERPCLRLACDLPDDEGSVYTTWFDQETLLPLRSEISAEGTVVFEVAWTRFEVTGGGEPAVPAVPAEPGAPQEGTSDWTAADEAAAYASAEE
ncbi:MAG: hypothetical protein HFF81_04715 [Oscillospiraceae bacterium]|nr:hypothetical protein [Oscillospiraceae bacterium]